MPTEPEATRPTIKGTSGIILEVNLTTRQVSRFNVSPEDRRLYLGGKGLGLKYISERLQPGVDALSEKNVLCLMMGVVLGSKLPCSGRFNAVSKSPLTHGIMTSSCGGPFGMAYKTAGYEGLILTGRAQRPTTLVIDSKGVTFEDGLSLWGKDTQAAQAALELGKNDGALVIGPAGENLVWYANICSGHRYLGRGGLGAVMGSKNLKAIVCGGTQKITSAAEEFLKVMAKEITTGLETSPFTGIFTKWGTNGGMDSGWSVGDVPAKNWQVGLWEGGEAYVKIGGQRMAETILKPHANACFNCPIRCARWVEVPSGRFKYEGPGPEYETVGAFGSMLLIDDLEAISWIGELCNKAGMDTISAGSTVAWAMEAFEKGALTKKDTGGLELTWGNVDAVLTTVEQMGKVEGFGALLAKGSREASRIVGKGSEEYAIQVKGMEVPMHDPRAFFSMAVNYATGMRGACHVQGLPYVMESGVTIPEAGIIYKQGRHEKKNKGLAAKVAQNMSAVCNSTAICMFAGLGLQPSHYGALLGITGGIPFDANGVLQAGDRIINVQRAFACREGITRKDDTLPKRLITPLPDGGAAGKAADLEYQLNEYYQLRGWSENGIPTKAKLTELGLQKIAEDLKL